MAKVSLQHIKGNSFYTTGIFAIGIYKYGDFAILIDSGSDERSAKDAYDALLEEELTPAAIINTHCHPDHCGGNYFFQKLYPDLKVYAAYEEKIFIEDPLRAPRCFCGNAAPFSGLRNKHIAPQNPSIVTHVIPYQDNVITILNETIKIITLPGHTPGSIGVITPDNVLYSGDALFGQNTFNKHPVLFYTDIENTLISFKKLASLHVDACVLYHGGVIYDLPGITKQHEARILEIKDTVLSMVQGKPTSIDMLTQQIIQLYKVPGNIVSFTLTQTTMRAYLTKLESEKTIELKVVDGLLQAIAIE